MAKRVDVTIGLYDSKQVRAYTFLPGLAIHKDPTGAPEDDYLNITYIRTGTAVATKIRHKDVKEAKRILAKADWTKPVDKVQESEHHKQVSLEAMKLSNHEKSLKQETRIAVETAGKRQPGSGSRWGARRDVITPRFLIEAKTTGNGVYYLDTADLGFLRKQAYTKSRVPAYIVGVQAKEELVLLPTQDCEDDVVTGAEILTRNWATKTSISLTAEMAETCMKDKIYRLDLSIGTFYCMCYTRFLVVAKRGINAD